MNGSDAPIADRPIVLVGSAPSSGSTLLSVLLDAHPDVFCGPELAILSHPFVWSGSGDAWAARLRAYLSTERDHRTLEDWRLEHGVCSYIGLIETAHLEAHGVSAGAIAAATGSMRDWRELVEVLFSGAFVASGKRVLAEKSPTNLYGMVAFLEAVPKGRGVIIVRDGRDVVCSLLARGFSLALSAALWTVEAALSRALATHERVHLLRYEDLVRSPEPVLRELTEFLGISPDVAAMLAYGAGKRSREDESIRLPTWRNTPQGAISDSSIARWREELSSDEVAIVQGLRVVADIPDQPAISGVTSAELLEGFGYALEPVDEVRIGRLATEGRDLLAGSDAPRESLSFHLDHVECSLRIEELDLGSLREAAAVRRRATDTGETVRAVRESGREEPEKLRRRADDLVGRVAELSTEIDRLRAKGAADLVERVEGLAAEVSRLLGAVGTLERHGAGGEGPTTRELLILTHDAVDQLDRRIVNEARVFVDRGWQVRILLTSMEKCGPRALERSIELLPVWVQELEPVADPLWDADATGPSAPATLKARVASALRPGSLPFRAARKVYRAGKRVVAVVGAGGASSPEAAPGTPIDWYPLFHTTTFTRVGRGLQADAVMACDLPALPAATTLSKEWGVPLIYDSHELYVEQSVFTERQRAVMEHHEAIGLEHAALTMIVSERFADELREKYSLARRPEVLYNAPSFRPRGGGEARQAIREELGLAGDESYLLYHGGIVRGRNIERMVEAFRAVAPPEYRLVLLGYGDAFDEFAREARGAEGRVIVHEAVPQDDLVHWVGGARAVIVPYLTLDKAHEFALPNKLFDCIELSTPVVANRSMVSIGEILAQFGIGHSGPMDTDDGMRETLRGAFAFLASCDAQRLEAAFEGARARYGWAAQEREFARMLHEIGLPGF